MNMELKDKYKHLWDKYDFYGYLLTEETSCVEREAFDELESVLKRKDVYAQYLGEIVADIKRYERNNIDLLGQELVSQLREVTDAKIRTLLERQERNKATLLEKQRLLSRNRADLLTKSRGIGIYNNQRDY